jgi:predicted TIM-barrel fold metal-dependent hydrolase
MAVNQNLAKAPMFLVVVMAAVAAFGPLACPRPATQGAREPADYRRASLPVFDIHTHLDPTATDVILPLFDARNVRMAVNLLSIHDEEELDAALAQERATHGRIIPFCGLPWRDMESPDFVQRSVAVLERCRARGVRGLKIPKVLGLNAIEPDGSRMAVDSPRLDPIFEACGRLGMVVLIHSADPRAFFQPATPANERWDELSAHPRWSFADPRYPSWDALLSEFERRVLRHPGTTFIGAHFGNAAEDPARVARLLERAPNYYIDTSARVPEFGRHNADTMRAFFIRWQDRVLFGTDLGLSSDPSHWVMGSHGLEATTTRDVDRFFTSTFRYFESRDRRIETPTPIQGRWTIDGVGLPRDVLAKIYGGNAARLLHVPWPPR